ncbi:hypothetical protein [Microbispora siamensis]|uniref:Lipoprotein n=1 Tax=Microbispora siamensis TaxID=564413 RepID=A0ABQ4H0I9_9ACTN|nr:hypothetical protein [Microbispora siamensis]GIH67201.1 hypothetical protein Msi02_80180 [Microbispora siamensis]
MISPRTFSRTVPAAAVAVLAASVTLAACTASSGGSGKAASGDEAAPSASSGPPALTPEAYRSALDAAGRPARTTLAAIAKARTFRSLHQRIGRAESALESALERLGGLRPPADVAPEHADYVAALRGLNGRLGALDEDVTSHALCNGTAVLARLGRSGEFKALRASGGDLAKAGDYPVVQIKPPAQRARRLGNGTMLLSAIRGGRSSLTVQNGGAQDGVVTLVRGGRKAVSFYVRKRSSTKVANIKDGTYRVYFTTGVDYDRSSRAFSRNCGFSKFDDPLTFRTLYSGGGVSWKDWTLTLDAVFGGNATTSEVDPDAFPA